MNNETDIQEKLHSIAQSGAEQFEFDEAAIQSEYSKTQTDQSSIAIKILSIAGGFFATLAFDGFLFVAGLYNSKEGLVLTGLIFIAASIWINAAINKLTLDTLSVTAYATGYILIAFGLGELNMGENAISVLFIIISVITLCINQNYIISFISVLIINGSILFLIINNRDYSSIHIYNALMLIITTFIFLNEAKVLKAGKVFSRLYNPLKTGLVISLMMGLVFVGKRGLLDSYYTNLWITSLISIPLIIYVVSVIIKVVDLKDTKSIIATYVLSTLILLPTAISPAISGTLLIVLLSFLVSYKPGLAIGIAAFIYFISQFYYDLNFTLLTKSILLFSSGIVFLIFYLLIFKNHGSTDEV